MNLELTSKRLALTPLATDDVELAVALFTDPDVVRYLGGKVMSEAAVRASIATWTKRGGDGEIGNWCISDRNSGEKYGIGLLLPIPIEEEDTDWDLVIPGVMPEGDIELGFILRKSAWGRGIATEVCWRLLQFAFEEAAFDELVATLEDDNLASRTVLEKCGFRDRGRRLAYGEDSPDLHIRRSQWQALAATF